MPRRMIDPEIWRNENVGILPDAGRLLFIGIFSNADDDGRIKGSPRFLKATIFPYDDEKTEAQVKKLRDECAGVGLIRIYNKNSHDYLDLPGWHEHQHIRKDRYNPSELPSCDEADDVWQPSGNQVATTGIPSIVKFSIVKSSIEEEGSTTTSTLNNPLLDFLNSLKGWQADEDDVHWLKGLRSEFPGLTPSEFKACVDYHSGRAPPKHKGIWKNRFRNWMIKERQFSEEGRKGEQEPRLSPKSRQGRRKPITYITGSAPAED